MEAFSASLSQAVHAEILGQLQSLWTAAGFPPLQLFTKYVPNLSNGPPTGESVRKAIKQSRLALQVRQCPENHLRLLRCPTFTPRSSLQEKCSLV